MTPISLLADHWSTGKCDTTETWCSRLLAHDATLVFLRLSQSDRHGDGEQRYRESPQHGSSSLKPLKLYASRHDLRQCGGPVFLGSAALAAWRCTPQSAAPCDVRRARPRLNSRVCKSRLTG